MCYPQMSGHSVPLSKRPATILTLVRLRLAVDVDVGLQLILHLERLTTNLAYKASVHVHPFLMIAQILFVGERFLT